MPCPENLVGCSFIIKGKVGRRRRPSLSFLNRCHISIISSKVGPGSLLVPVWLGQDCHIEFWKNIFKF